MVNCCLIYTIIVFKNNCIWKKCKELGGPVKNAKFHFFLEETIAADVKALRYLIISFLKLQNFSFYF